MHGVSKACVRWCMFMHGAWCMHRYVHACECLNSDEFGFFFSFFLQMQQ